MIKKVKRVGFAVMTEVDDLDQLGGQESAPPPANAVVQGQMTEADLERLRRLSLPVTP